MNKLKNLLEEYGFKFTSENDGHESGFIKLEQTGSDLTFEFRADLNSMTIYTGIDGVGASFHGLPKKKCPLCEEGYPAKNGQHMAYDDWLGVWKCYDCMK